MLSIIYLKPLGEIISSFGIGCHQYVDLTQLYFLLSKFPGDTVEIFEHCLLQLDGLEQINWNWILGQIVGKFMTLTDIP